MPAIPLQVGDLVEVTMCGRRLAQNAMIVHHWRVSEVAALPATDEDVARYFDGAGMGNQIRNWMLTTDQWWGTKAQIIKPTRKVFADWPGNRGPGEIAGDGLPQQCAGLVTLRTLLPGPRGRGRKYFQLFSEGDSTGDGTPTAGIQAEFATLGATLSSTQIIVQTGRGVTLIPVIYHRDSGTWTDIFSFTVRTFWATQRRRSAINRPDAVPW